MQVVGPLIGLLVFIGVVGGAVYAFTRGRAEGVGITFPTVLAAYVALMVAISTLLIAAGGASLGKAAISEIERDYSYNIIITYETYEPVAPGAPVPPATPVEPRKDPDAADRPLRDDIAEGITFAAIGVVILGAHLALGRAVRRRAERAHQRNIDRALKLVMTAIGGVGFLVAGGIGLSRLLRRTVLETGLREFESPPHPGEPLAWAAVWLVVWLWFGALVWREFAAEGRSE